MNSPENFEDFAQYNIWLAQCKDARVGASEIANLLSELDHPVAHFRAAVLLLTIRPVNSERIYRLLDSAAQRGDPLLRNLIKAWRVFADVSINYSNNTITNTFVYSTFEIYENTALELKDFIGHPMKREADLKVQQMIFKSYYILEDTVKMLEASKHVYQLALAFGNAAIELNFRILYSDSFAVLSRWGESAALLSRPTDRKNVPLLTHQLSIALFNLGNISRAQALLSRYRKETGADDLLNMEQMIDSMYGRANFNRANLTINHRRYGWTVDAMLLMARASASPPYGKSLQAANEALREVLKLSEEALTRDVGDGDRLYVAWMRARCRLMLGEYGVVLSELSALPDLDSQDLYNRVLLCALELECLMLPLNQSRSSLPDVERKFRAIFQDVKTIPFADADGLIALVLRWHPVAAVYAALMPEPLREFTPALDLLLRVSDKASWQGNSVPPQLIAHLIRWHLRVPVLNTTLSGNAAYQVGRLTRQVGEATVWGPVVPLLPIIVALSRGSELHREAARRAWRDFGMLPKAHRDPELDGVIQIWRAVVNGDQPLADGLRVLQEL